MNTAGRSLELFFVDGRPDGMLTAEVFNWTGHVLRFPRTQLKEALQRKETTFTGVYILIGDKDDKQIAYIGEAEDVGHRLKDHALKKDWWETGVIVTTAANSLHKAYIKYLESRLIEIAKEVGAVQLENGNTPTKSSLSEASISKMESFLETLMTVLPAIRTDIFLNKKKSHPTSNQSLQFESSIEFEFKVAKNNVHAKAQLTDGELVVLKGSKVRPKWEGAFHASYMPKYNELTQNGVIEVVGTAGYFTQDFAFSSASAAAAVCAGRSANGRVSWKIKGTEVTYAEWEAQQIEATE